jgi:hypothetical protein
MMPIWMRLVRRDERRVALPQLLEVDPLAARHRLERERHRLEVDVAIHLLEPSQAVAGGLLVLLHARAPRAVRTAAARPVRLGASNACASAIASSSASFVPDPIEKCAVCNASPSRTTPSPYQRAFARAGS